LNVGGVDGSSAFAPLPFEPCFAVHDAPWLAFFDYLLLELAKMNAKRKTK